MLLNQAEVQAFRKQCNNARQGRRAVQCTDFFYLMIGTNSWFFYQPLRQITAFMTPNGRAGAAGKKQSQQFVDILKKKRKMMPFGHLRVKVYLLLRLKKGLMEELLILII